jgi:hypothetical protein
MENFIFKLKLTTEEIKDAVAEYLNNKGYVVCENMDYDIKERKWVEIQGDNRVSRSELIFNGITVKVKTK